MRWVGLLLVCGCSFEGAGPGSPDATTADASTSSTDAPIANANAFRRDIHIAPPVAVQSTVPDVAIPIRLMADSHYMQNGDPAGADILVHTDGGVALPIDIEILDVSAGELLVWVVAPSVATGGTDLYLFYGNGQVAPANSSNPWEGLADAVWHLDTVGAGPTASDATASGFHGTQIGGGSVTAAPAIHGNGFDWNGTQLLMDNNSDLDRGPADSFSTVLWFNQQTALSSFDFAFYNGGPIDNAPGHEFSLGTGDWTAGVRDTDGDEQTLVFGTEANLGGAGWNQLGLVFDRGTNTATVYVNGQNIASSAVANVSDLRNNDRRARIGGGANPPDALIDEFRAYTRALTDDYMLLDHALGTDPSVVTIDPALAVRYPGT